MRYLLALFLLVSLTSYGQDINSYISGAKSAYSSENYQSARENLQKAIFEIDKAISEEILKTLPNSLGDLTADKEQDTYVGEITFTGLNISRKYGKEDSEFAEVLIADNSPMLAVVSTFLANPMMTGIMGAMGDTGQKQVTINGYKGMMQKEADDDGDYSIMIPFDDTLLVLETNVQDEGKVMDMANQIPIRAIAEILR